MNSIIMWLSDNKEWIFSGAGIVIVVGLLKWLRNRKMDNTNNPSTDEKILAGRDVNKSTASDKGIAVGNVGGDVKIYQGKELDHPNATTEISPEAINGYTSALIDEVESWGGLELKRSVRLKDIYVSRVVERPSGSPEESIPEKELLQQLLNKTFTNQKILIEGPAGCGKSTLLKNWVFDLVKRPCDIVSREYVPIWLPLGEVRSWDMSIVELVSKKFPPDATGQMSGSLVSILALAIDSGNAFILLDAADEVQQGAHHNFKIWLNETYNSARRCPIVVTSRPGDFTMSIRGDTFHIEPFNPEKRELFIHRWFHAANRVDLIDPMTKKLGSTPRLNEDVLVGNPLFLTIMCIDFEYRKEIADTPGMILEHFIHILLEFWDREKCLVTKTSFQSKIQIDLKLRVLESVAAHFFEQDSRIFKQRELEEHVSTLLENLNSQVQPDKIIEEIVSRSSILVTDRLGQFRFNHPLFQEFFVARDRVERRRMGESQEEWLLSGYSNPRFNNIIQYYDELITYDQRTNKNKKAI